MKPKCPNCGNTDAYYNADCYNMEDYGNYLVKCVITTCPKCKTVYKWREIFDFSSIEGLTTD